MIFLTKFAQKGLLHKKCPYSELFWSAFSRIWTIQSKCGKKRTRITPNTDAFEAEDISCQKQEKLTLPLNAAYLI